ncbi:MAG: hypothetical protein LBV57_01445 [Candidatus Symbiothrix sp.]|jgi:hypothetical protein|nr:hypothetical protein [Candidatus Symbiothrix sp.]
MKLKLTTLGGTSSEQGAMRLFVETWHATSLPCKSVFSVLSVFDFDPRSA